MFLVALIHETRTWMPRDMLSSSLLANVLCQNLVERPTMPVGKRQGKYGNTAHLVMCVAGLEERFECVACMVVEAMVAEAFADKFSNLALLMKACFSMRLSLRDEQSLSLATRRAGGHAS